MSKASRNKGQSGEREVCAILNEALGTSLNRTLDQVRDGVAILSLVITQWKSNAKND